MRICIIGAGAMGSLYGAMLARGGAEIVLFDQWAEHIEKVRRDGLRLSGITGDFTVEVEATSDPEAIDRADLCISQVNTYATTAAAEVAQRVLGRDGYCLTLQNGVGNIEKLVAVLGEHRVMGGLSYHSAAMGGPGHGIHTHAGPTWLGELDGRRTARLDSLVQLLAQSGFEPTVVDDIQGFIWGKFIHNCSINPICAVAGIRVGQIPMDEAADTFQTRIIEEALAIIRAKGITVPEADPMTAIKKFCKVKFNKPSMLQHVEAGKRTEIDSLNGVIVEEGRTHGIPTPFNEALTLMVRAIDARNAFVAKGPVDFDALETQRKAEVG
jgi:2-dehydropantoate 2-reductase